MTHSPTQIVVNVFGGVVQDVFCSDVEAQVTVVDWDTEGTSGEELIEVQVAAGRTLRALVSTFAPGPLSDLAGSDVEAALEAADAEPVS